MFNSEYSCTPVCPDLCEDDDWLRYWDLDFENSDSRMFSVGSWREMSYYLFDQDILDFHYSLYSDGEWEEI
jgi:hypothetical protein